MRIAIYHNLPSGGGKRALQEMTRRLVVGHTVDVYSLSCADHDFCDLRPLVQQHIVVPFTPWPLLRSPLGRLNQAVYSANLLRLRAAQRAIANRIDGANYDVVFVHHCRYAQAPAVLGFLTTPTAYYCAEPPRVFTEQLHERLKMQAPSLRRKLDRIDPLIALHRNLVLRLDRQNALAATKVLTNSAFSRESIYRVYGLAAGVSYLGVDVRTFRHLALPKENFVVSVGAITPQKGHDFVIRSLALIPTAPRPHLVIVGNQTNADECALLESLANELNVTVQFRHQVSDEELVKIYNQALLTVCMPIMEPFGFVPLESMACGTPVVGACEGGIRESVLHEQTGLLVERDSQHFADAVNSLLGDEVRREHFAKRSIEVASERWSWDVSVRHLETRLAALADK